MVLDLVTYPNKILFKKSEQVTKFDEKLHAFLDDMYETMCAKGGIGLAAVQVANPIRAVVINLLNKNEIQDKADLIELINPQITEQNGEILYQEGCLSVPGFYEDVKRAEKVKVKFQDRFGETKFLEASNLLAVCIQHELDHLNGHLFIEKIGYSKRKQFDKEFKELTKNSKKNSKKNR